MCVLACDYQMENSPPRRLFYENQSENKFNYVELAFQCQYMLTFVNFSVDFSVNILPNILNIQIINKACSIS